MTKPTVPQNYLDLVQSKRAFAHLATLMPDGSPQVTPVWFDYDGEHFIVNSARGRLKDKNMRRDGRVALEIMDPDDGYRYLEVRGTVVDITEEGADASIDRLAHKYLGVDSYPNRRADEQRVIYKIAPTKIKGNR